MKRIGELTCLALLMVVCSYAGYSVANRSYEADMDAAAAAVHDASILCDEKGQSV